jgi:virginiamycin B lyase
MIKNVLVFIGLAVLLASCGQGAVLDPATGERREWLLPGERPLPYAVYVDEHDRVWLSDIGADALVRFDPEGDAERVGRGIRRSEMTLRRAAGLG